MALLRRFSRAVSGMPLWLLLPVTAAGQTAKETNVQVQSWWSVNSTLRLTDRFGAIGDLHLRRNDFLADPSFFLVRAGAHYWLSDSVTATLGYAHNRVAPAREDWHTWTKEDRLYQQVQYASRLGKAGLLQRLRNEQRWQEEVEADQLTGERRFSDRVRYLLSFTVPLSSSPSATALVLSDEVLLQFGPEIVLNTFDQNRLFVGIKKRLGASWSFDLGYMLVYQQKASGYQYDLNHTLRCFFYYSRDLRRGHSGPPPDPAGSE